ncbi:hypothetical protein ACFE04_019317 [Oxalis oulophora]
MGLNVHYCGNGSLETKLSITAGVSCHEKVFMGSFTDWFLTFLLDRSSDMNLLNAVSIGYLDVVRFVTVTAICNTVIPLQSKTGPIVYKALSQDEEALVYAAAWLHLVFFNKNGNNTEVRFNTSETQYEVLDTLEFTSNTKRIGYLDVVRFVTVTAICNTVIPVQSKTGPIVYKAQSQDEEALVYVAAWLHLVFSNKNGNNIEVRFNSSETQYEVLDTLEFTSDTKRMSVVVQDCQNGNIILLTKGADKTIIPLAHTGNLCDNKHGLLHTLCLAWRELKKDEYMEWSLMFKEASSTLVDREWRKAKVCLKLEHDLTILGVTAIEDRLETIATLKKAGINFWMLTGDNQDTAIQIALSYNYSVILRYLALEILLIYLTVKTQSMFWDQGVGSGGTKVDNDTNFGS